MTLRKTLVLLSTWLLPLSAVAQTSPSASDSAEVSTSSGAVDLFARDTFRIDRVVCPFKGQIRYEPGEMECGFLRVPENRENPESRFIDLHFVKLSSTWDDEERKRDSKDDGLAPGRRDDPVIYLTGGPGAQVTTYVKRFKDHGIRKHRDLYILEQRGIGSSGDFCPFYGERRPELMDVKTFEANLDAAIEQTRQCAEGAKAAGVDLRGYNTIENARDVKALRRALGFKNWNVWGISYGSILGQAYLKEDPEGIRAVALDAIVPLAAREDAYWRIINWYDRDLKKLDEACQANSSCAGRYPDLGERVREAAKEAASAPIVVDVKDTEVRPSGKAHFFQDIAGLLPFALFYEQDNYPALPGVIYAWTDAIKRRDPTLFRALGAAAGSGAMFGGISRGMYDAILCLDGDVEGQAVSLRADLKDHPVLAGAFTSEESLKRRVELCGALGLAPRPASEYAPVETEIPALIIEGDMDPITPPPLAKAILPGFKNGTYVEFPYAGHGPSRSVKCAGDMLNKFYDNPTAKPDLSCVDEMEAPAFFWMYPTGIVPKLMVVAFEDRKALIGPAAWGGVSALLVLVAFLALTLGPLGRRMDGVSAAPTCGARWAAWFATTFGVLALGVFGAAFAVTYKMSELLLLFGLVSWARFGVAAGVAAGVFGLAAVLAAVRARMFEDLPLGTTLGLIVAGLAPISLSVFFLVWDLGPF